LANSRKIKGVLFDVDGTLYYQFPVRVIMIAYLISMNILNPRELIRKIKIIKAYRIAQEQLRTSIDNTMIKSKDQFAATVDRTGESYDYVTRNITEWFDKKPLPLLRFCRRQGLLKFLTKLKKEGMVLAVFSDYPAVDKLKALGVSKYFKTVVSSYDSGVTGFKPDTNGFSIAAEKMDLKPSEILYVGDRIDIDGKGAISAGMNVVIINGLSPNKIVSKIPVANTLKGVLWQIFH
jgi:putative hydrolase of the HAD superfamily